MRIHNHAPALNAWRSWAGATSRMDRHLARLSSGQRITRAADDAAGLGISEKLRAGIGGMRQAMRNVQDGIAFVQTVEGSLTEVHDMLQRALELAVYAGNGTLSAEDRESLQIELSHLVAEVDRIADATEFNGRKVLGGSDAQARAAVDSLRRSWLAEAENLVSTHYGLQADDVELKIVFDQFGDLPAYVTGVDLDADKKLDNLELHLILAKIDPLSLPNGGQYPQYADRIIAHEMTHAVMARSMNFTDLPTWFIEGSAEFIAGADERLNVDLALAGSAGALVNNSFDTAWTTTSAHYSSAYAAAKYLDDRVRGAGGAGMRDVMTQLSGGATLDAAINTATAGAYADAATFLADFKGAAGQAFVSGLNLTDADVGAIGGLTTGGPVRNATDVVPDSNTDTWNPLTRFVESWPELQTEQNPVRSLQVGAYAGHTLDLPEIVMNSFKLGIAGLDLRTDAVAALDALDAAVQDLSGIRGTLGGIQNRLEHAYNANAVVAESLSASESAIRDADMAMEMTHFAREQILVQASAAMMAQANVVHGAAMRTLLGA